jgi:hypothetical protein
MPKTPFTKKDCASSSKTLKTDSVYAKKSVARATERQTSLDARVKASSSELHYKKK